MRRIEVLQDVDDSFGGGGEGEGGSSFVSLEDVISFVAETKTLMNPSETPSLDTLPIPDADWGLEQVVDGISLQNILQVSFHMKGLGIQATALVSNGYIKTRLLISSKTLLFSSPLSSISEMFVHRRATSCLVLNLSFPWRGSKAFSRNSCRWTN